MLLLPRQYNWHAHTFINSIEQQLHELEVKDKLETVWPILNIQILSRKQVHEAPKQKLNSQEVQVRVTTNEASTINAKHMQKPSSIEIKNSHNEMDGQFDKLLEVSPT